MRTKFKYRSSKNDLYGFIPLKFLTLIFLYWLSSFWIALPRSCCLKGLWAEWQKSETSLENSKRFHAKCRKSGKTGKAQKKVQRSKKNIAGQVLTYNSKNFHWLNRKLDLERTMNGLGKPFRKNTIQKKIEKTVKIEVKFPHVNKKKHSRESEFLFKHRFLSLP